MKNIYKNQRGIAHLTIIGLLLVFVVVGFTGWRVWEARKDANQKLDSGNSTPTQAKESNKEEPKLPDGFVKYTNKEIGFTFAYPKDWGEVKVTDNKDQLSTKAETGNRYTFSFTNEKKAQVGLAEKNWKILAAKDGPCVAIGFSDYIPYQEVKDGTVETIDGKYVVSTSKFLEDSPSMQVREDYGPQGGICYGFDIEGQKKFENSNKYNGANASYLIDDIQIADNDKQAQDLVNAYKKDTTKIVSDKIRTQMIELTKSLNITN